MIHEQRPDHKSTETKPRPLPLLPTPPPVNLAEHLSDCGHGSPQVKRSQSLLRNFSLRSRKSFTLHKSSRVQPSLASSSTPGNGRTPISDSNGGNSSLSIWKKWRVKSVSERSSRNTSEGAFTPHHDPMSSPMTQAPGRKRSFFLTVSRLVAPFQISSPSSSSSEMEGSSCPQPEPIHGFDTHFVTVVKDENDNRNGNGNSPSCFGIDDGIIRQVDGSMDGSKAETQIEIHTKTKPTLNLNLEPTSPESPLSPVPSLPPCSSTSPPFPILSLGSPSLPPSTPLPDSPLLLLPASNSPIDRAECDSDLEVDCGDVSGLDVDQDSIQDVIEDLITCSQSLEQEQVPHNQIQVPSNGYDELSFTPVDLDPVLVMIDDASEPLPLFSTYISNSTFQSNPQLSSNFRSDLIPNLKSSLSQKRRPRFTLDDGSDLDSYLLAVPVPASVLDAAAAARGEEARAESDLNVGSSSVSMVIPNGSAAQTTTPAVGKHRTLLTLCEGHVDETRDQCATPSSSIGTTAATTTNVANFKSTRRWTLSSVLTDESISNEGLIKELERMRDTLEWDCTPIEMNGHDAYFSPSSFPPPSPPPSSLLPSLSNPSPTWLTTQRALLTTRELILTERHYLSSLLLLLCPDSTVTPVPKMMIPYVKALVGVSERLLKGMEGEPSIRGVAAALVGGQVNEDGNGAESAFVGWCGVVGGWFQDDLAVSGDTQAVVSVRRRRKSGVGGGDEHHPISDHEGSADSTSSSPTSTNATEYGPLMRTVSAWRRSMPSITGLGEGGGAWRRDKDEGGSTYGHGHRGRTLSVVGTSSSTSTSSSKPIRKPTVRDLAILPTQRVMRYVLLYRDLLANTPPLSSSYPIVERAVGVACRIAEKCDRAQGNAAFIAVGSPIGSPSSSMLNNSNNGRRSSSKRATLPEPSLKLKTVWGSTAHAISSSSTKSVTGSPTKSYFLPSPISPSQLPSKLLTSLPSISSSSPPSPSSSKSTLSSLPLPASPTKSRLVKKPLSSPSPPPPSSFHSKIPIARSGRSSGSLSTYSDATTATPYSSSSSSVSSALSTPLSSPSSSGMPKSLSTVSVMSLVNGLGRSVSGTVAGDGGGATVVDSGPAGRQPTKIKV